MPVKFPGWSQPGVWGLQARIEAMKKARKVRRVVYMVAIGGWCFYSELLAFGKWLASMFFFKSTAMGSP